MDDEELLELLNDPEADYLYQLSVNLSSGIEGLGLSPPPDSDESEVLLGGLRNLIYSRYLPEVAEQAAAATTVTELLALIYAS